MVTSNVVSAAYIVSAVRTPIGPLAGELRLGDHPQADRLHELHY